MTNQNISQNEKEKEKEIVSQEITEDTSKISEELQSKVDKLQDMFLRAKAENDNLRKRFSKELEDSNKYAITKFTKSLIEQVENLFRASNNIDLKSQDIALELETLFQGVKMTQENLLKVFKNFSIQRIYPINQVFDHTLHEAISQVVDKEKDKNTIIDVIQAGYTLHERLIRPAVVVVTKKEE